jgi:hypothetical protein
LHSICGLLRDKEDIAGMISIRGIQSQHAGFPV